MRCAVAILTALLVATSVAPAAAEWRRTTDVSHNTAFTLDQGTLEVGVMTPLTVGVTDDIQAAIHPILLLLGVPYVAVRWRVTQPRDVTFAINLAGSWSFIRREDAEGIPQGEDVADGDDTGFPGTVQLTGTFSFRTGEDWLLSVGAGGAVDWLSAVPIRGMVELHASAHWLPASDWMLMLNVLGYLDPGGDDVLRRPAAEFMVAYAMSHIAHIGLGVGFGEFIFEESDTERKDLQWFPVIDVWFRF